MAELPSLGPRGEGWVAIQIVLYGAIGLAGIARPGGWTGRRGTVAAVGGGLLVAGGGLLATAGGAALHAADALAAVPRPREEARLVDTGAYRLVRHPMYGGLVLGAVGWGLVRGSAPALILTAMLLVFVDLKRRREEAWLAARYPGYAAYRARTRRLIPWIY